MRLLKATNMGDFFIPTDGDWDVCLHTLRLLQSMLVEEEVLFLLGSSLLDPELQMRVGQLTSSGQANLRLAAQQILEDLQALQQVPSGIQAYLLSCSWLCWLEWMTIPHMQFRGDYNQDFTPSYVCFPRIRVWKAWQISLFLGSEM